MIITSFVYNNLSIQDLVSSVIDEINLTIWVAYTYIFSVSHIRYYVLIVAIKLSRMLEKLNMHFGHAKI